MSYARAIGAAGLLAVSVVAADAAAHIVITSPQPRSPLSNLQRGPCGGIARGAGGEPTVYRPGETILIEWDETVDHPGTWRIAFSPSGDTGFDENVLAEGPDEEGTGPYAQMVTLPLTPCEDCTIQVYQWMDPRFHPPPDYYYSCADIVIRAAAEPDAGAGVDAGPAGVDGGSSGDDAGTPRADAGRRDAGRAMVGGEEGGCSVAGHAGGPGPGAVAAALIGLAVIAGARARRRRA